MSRDSLPHKIQPSRFAVSLGRVLDRLPVGRFIIEITKEKGHYKIIVHQATRFIELSKDENHEPQE